MAWGAVSIRNLNGFLISNGVQSGDDHWGMVKGRRAAAMGSTLALLIGYGLLVGQSNPNGTVLFEKKIRPVLVEKCYPCHSEKAPKLRANLKLDSREGMLKGGDLGPALVVGKPAESPLVKALHYQDEQLRMPPSKPLDPSVVADFETWIALGAPWPDASQNLVKDPGLGGAKPWAWTAPKRIAPPIEESSPWAKTPIDQFLFAKMRLEGLSPSPEADPRVLVRRLAIDLVGVPLRTEEAEAFAEKPTREAYVALVDKLLADPGFGERWGRHWLDIARYADTSGRTVNANHPNAWRYRDYVIDALNGDKPYDLFVLEQLAGDLLPSKNEQDRAEKLIATGFLAVGPKALNERNTRQFQADLADEQLDTVFTAFLATSLACARCHDHKFDPISQKDYTRISGIFQNTDTRYGTIRLIQNIRPSKLQELPKGAKLSNPLPNLTKSEMVALQEDIQSLKAKRLELIPSGKLFTSPEGILTQVRLATAESRLESYTPEGTPKNLAMGVKDKTFPGDTPLYIRGEVDRPGQIVARGVPDWFAGTRAVRKGSGRLELAHWIASKDNPLTARVMVNRVWSHLMGRPLVETPDNFGLAGRLPTHPGLLDYLAISFVEDGWSVKRLVRQILLSRAYAQSSHADPKAMEIDPEGAYYWRMTPRRHDAEVLRDTILWLGGDLQDGRRLGSPVSLAGEGLVRGGQRQGLFTQPFNGRSVYLPVIRDNPDETLALFDFPQPDAVQGDRPTTTVASQALFLLNNPLVLRESEKLAAWLLKESPDSAEQIRKAFLVIHGRPPTSREGELGAAFLRDFRAKAFAPQSGRNKKEALAAFGQALLAHPDFLYRR